MCVCVCVCVRACMRACVHACVCVLNFRMRLSTMPYHYLYLPYCLCSVWKEGTNSVATDPQENCCRTLKAAALSADSQPLTSRSSTCSKTSGPELCATNWPAKLRLPNSYAQLTTAGAMFPQERFVELWVQVKL